MQLTTLPLKPPLGTQSEGQIEKGLIPFLHQKGVAPFTIKDLAGHKSLNTTMRYVKIENREQAVAIAFLSKHAQESNSQHSLIQC